MEKRPAPIAPPTNAPPSFEHLVALFYFQIFSHPLKLQELHRFSQKKDQTTASVEAFLEQGIKDGLIFCRDSYYMLEDKPEWIQQRRENEKRASQYLKKTHKIVHLIRRFPFVEAVFLSGSISKGVVSTDGDVDYFIITKPDRLWLTRSLLVLFKKIFLFNSHRYFCINYLIDTSHLEIEEKSRFTATEIVTLLPVFNTAHYQLFWETNKWIRTYYPNARPRQALIAGGMPPSKIKLVMEKLLSGSLGEWLDIWAMRLSIKYWKRKFKFMDNKHFEVALKSRPYVSKHHPQNFQHKVSNAFYDQVRAFEEKHGFSFKQIKK